MSVLGPVDFGSVNNKGTTYLDEFSPGEKVIGFYGSYNDKEITSLGFLTHDPECIRIPEPEPEPEVIPEIEVELDVVAEVQEETSGMGIGIILGAVGAGLVVIILVVVGLLCWRRRRNNKDLVEVAFEQVKVGAMPKQLS